MIINSDNKNIFFLDPIPIWKRIITEEEIGQSIDDFNSKLLKLSKNYYKEWELEVPDERHIDKSQMSDSEYEELNNRDFVLHSNSPAVGKWHSVKTNNFLDINEPEIRKLKELILNDFQTILEYVDGNDLKQNTKIDESWIQYYKNGDYKVLHNHLRYDKNNNFNNIWAGGYYINDGDPDKYQPYSGRFSFDVRNNSYLIKPKTGMIMLWPGDTLHQVYPFYGNCERVCINFNLSTYYEKNYFKIL